MSTNQTNITVHDLKTIKELIECAAKNGIITPSNMCNIGAVYEKVDATVNNITSQYTDSNQTTE